jgi:hypothetical protein
MAHQVGNAACVELHPNSSTICLLWLLSQKAPQYLGEAGDAQLRDLID